MENNVLITGGSGYLGGTLLNRLKNANLPSYKLYALVRNEKQAEAVAQYGADHLQFDISDKEAVRQNILKYKINMIFSLVDALGPTSQENFIAALTELKRTTQCDVHFLHTSGAKMMSNHAGARIDPPIRDNDMNLFALHKDQKAPIALMQRGVDTNVLVTQRCEELGIHSYVFFPCIVYGKGEGFGNLISIQTVAIVKAAKAMRKVYRVDNSRTTWPVCHVVDNANLYIELLRGILENQNPSFGQQGFYLAASGSVAWDDIYKATAIAMYKRGLVDDDAVHGTDETSVDMMAKALGCTKQMVAPQLSGQCSFVAEHGSEYGWKPQYPAEFILASMDAEVELIVSSLKD